MNNPADQTPDVTTNSAGGVAINGALTVTTVADLFARHPQIGSGQSDAGVAVDLGAVSHVDSAGLALLIEWDSAARRGGSSLHFTDAPESLRSLARVAGIGERFA